MTRNMTLVEKGMLCFFNFNYTMPTVDKLFKNKNLILHPALPSKLKRFILVYYLEMLVSKRILVKHRKNID